MNRGCRSFTEKPLRKVLGRTLAAAAALAMASAPVPAMAVSITGYAMEGANDASVGTLAWNIPNTPDPTDATVLPSPGVTSNYLKLTGFDFSGLPADAHIVAIVARIYRSASGSIVDNSVVLQKDGVQVGNNEALPGAWPDITSDSLMAEYRPADPLWGATWTAADLQDHEIALLVSARNPEMTGDFASATLAAAEIEVVFVGCPAIQGDCRDQGPDVGVIQPPGKLSVLEAAAGKEKLGFSMKFAVADSEIGISPTDFGNPTIPDGAEYSICVYDDNSALVTSFRLDAPGAMCGDKPCWKTSGEDYPANSGATYTDKSGAADGLTQVKYSYKAGKSSSIKLKADNKSGHMPLGTTAGLASASVASVAISSSSGKCFFSTINDFSKQTATQTKGQTNQN